MPALVARPSEHSLSRPDRYCEKVAVLLSVFGDESADDKQQRVFAVSGILGDHNQWDYLASKWQARTGGKIFHAADCDSDNGDFADTTHAENKQLYKDLTQILCESKLMGTGVAIDLAGHREFFPDVPRDIPYFRCFSEVVRQCGRWAIMSIPQDTVEFIFDQRPESNASAGLLYDYMVNSEEWRSSATLFSDKISFATRKLVGIQAADLLSRETMKHLNNTCGPVKRGTRRSMQALMDSKRFGFRLLTREYFEDFSRKFDDVATAVGVHRDEYMAWLVQYGVKDSIASRHRYLIHLDAIAER